ncbi:MAG: type ISP restriction/modification enzyme, partial [Pseudanabaena sp.]
VFSSEYNREGIRTGTAIALMVQTGLQKEKSTVRFRQLWGTNKRQELLSSLQSQNFNGQYDISKPIPETRFSFRPSNISDHYLEWAKLTDICAVAPSNGLMEKRGGALIDIDRNALEERMRAYFDYKLSWEDYKGLNYGLVKPQASFDPKLTRSKVLVSGQFNPERIVRYALRPFETRWCYYTSESSIWNRSRPSLWNQCWEGNSFLMTRPAGVASPEGCPLFFTRLLGDNDFLRGHAYYFPLRLMNGARLKAKERLTLLEILGEKPEVDLPLANLSDSARAYLKHLGFPNPDEDQETAILIWMHALAIGYSPAYLQQNHDGIQQDFPRIPLPNSRDLLITSANLGKQLAQLLDTEAKIEGVTVGKINPELRNIGVISKLGGGKLNPDQELSLTVGWGHAGKEGVTMPGKGKVQEREYSADELKVLNQPMQTLLGKTTLDIYLNDVAYWKNIPTRVWGYTIGGYQVIKKWLSYREETLLGRSLNVEEVREVSNITRRIAAILLLEEQLDHNYETIQKATYDWQRSSS